MRYVLLGCIAALLLSGCAGYSITSEQTGKEGYVVYEPWPYLMQTNIKGDGGKLTGYSYEVIYLPNRSRSYRIRTWAGLSKADFQFDFENGWMLKGIHDKSDNTALMKTIAGLIPKYIPGPGERVPEGAAADLEPEPVLFRMEFDDCGRVCGLTPVKPNEDAASCSPRPCPQPCSPCPPPCPPPPCGR